MLLLYMKHGKLPHRLIYVHGITAHHCYIWKKCFLVAVLLTKNVDNINRTLDLSKLHQYLISLLRKMQNTFETSAISRFGRWEFFPKKEHFSPKRRSHQWDPEYIKIMSVSYFLIK